jgi:glutamate carboxypeptidase
MMAGVDWPTLQLIDDGQNDSVLLLRRWAEINSGTFHLAGLFRMEEMLLAAFSPLADRAERIEIPPAETVDDAGNIASRPLGKALRFTKRANAPLRVLLSIHYDTVYGADHPFQRTELLDADTLRGPGVVDAKGGIIVMLSALRALEASDVAGNIGWEMLLNPDEEIGSPGSAGLLAEAANRNHFGLVYEPAMADGSLVGGRKGSGTFTAVVRGRAAHAGRDFDKGRSAIAALAEMIRALESQSRAGVIINCGQISGGGAVNIVPDLAVGRFNVRANTPADQGWVENVFGETAKRIGSRDGISVTIHGKFNSPPKLLDVGSQRLMDQIIDAGRELGMSLGHRPSGGTCDGNKLAAAGLAVVDSMGPVGGELHSEREFVRLNSLGERAKLTAVLLMRLASGASAR